MGEERTSSSLEGEDRGIWSAHSATTIGPQGIRLTPWFLAGSRAAASIFGFSSSECRPGQQGLPRRAPS